MISATVDVELCRGSNKQNRTGVTNALKLFKELNVRSTFFVTGDFAERNKDVVEEIGKEHEIACHSFDHPDYNKLNLKEIESDIRRNKRSLKKYKPLGFRTPFCRFSSRTLNALKKNGFKYDSSLMHSFFRPYLKYPNEIFELDGIKEIPISSYIMIPLDWRIVKLTSGYCIRLTKKIMRKLIVTNVHSWELYDMKTLRIWSDLIKIFSKDIRPLNNVLSQ